MPNIEVHTINRTHRGKHGDAKYESYDCWHCIQCPIYMCIQSIVLIEGSMVMQTKNLMSVGIAYNAQY
jgi:hypothetical protein